MKEEFDFDSIRKKTIEQLKAGKPLLGKDDAFAPLLTSILKARRCISYRRRNQMGNRRNSKMQKQLQISLGEVTVSTPRDRNVGYSVNVRVSNKWDYL